MNETGTDGRISWRHRLSQVFGLDCRSLAVFRISIGVMLIADLILRWPTVRMMCTDEGAVPRETVSYYWGQIFGQAAEWPLFSIHHFSGDYNFQVALFALSAIAAVFLIVGCWTRVATIVCWVLLASLHARNPFILSSGDMIMRLLIFWMIFLPAGRVWSIDAWRKRNSSNPKPLWVCNVASAGFIIQFVCMYVFTGIGKYNEVWLSGEAMQYVLRLDIYVNPYGRNLLEYPGMLKAITHATLWGEIGLPLLLFIPWKTQLFRLLNILAFVVLHLSIAATMVIGLFPFICIVCWLAFLPSIVWSVKTKQSEEVTGEKLRDRPRMASTGLAWLGSLAGLGFIAFVITWNINNEVKNCGNNGFLSKRTEGAGYYMMLDQYFLMFYRPPVFSPWFVYEAVLKDGQTIDLLTEEEPTDVKPLNIAATLRYHHVRKLHRNVVLVHEDDVEEILSQKIRDGLANFYVNQWQQSHNEEKQIVNFRLLCYKESIGPDANGFDRQTAVWHEFGQDGLLFEKEFNKMMKGLEGF